MPRLPRVYLPNTLYYVTVRGIYGQRIFKENPDYKMFLELLKKYKQDFQFKIYAYSLLPNHFHLLLELPEHKEERNISAIMHDLNSSYTKYFNGKYARKGHLFEGRFRATVIEKEPYLLRVSAYIHLNPQRLNLVSSPQDYPYSSYIFYIQKNVSLEGLIDKEKNEISRLLNGGSYQEFINAAIQKPDSYLHNLLKKGILGSEDFEEKVRKLFAKEKNKGFKQATKISIAAALAAIVVSTLIFTLKTNLGKKETSLDQHSIQQIRELLKDLEQTEWQIKIFPAKGGEITSDTIYFDEGKFHSENLSLSGYESSDYSLLITDEDTIIWETKQTSPSGIVSWRGEIKQKDMEGTLGLPDKNGNTQPYNFLSINYKKREND